MRIDDFKRDSPKAAKKEVSFALMNAAKREGLKSASTNRNVKRSIFARTDRNQNYLEKEERNRIFERIFPT